MVFRRRPRRRRRGGARPGHGGLRASPSDLRRGGRADPLLGRLPAWPRLGSPHRARRTRALGERPGSCRARPAQRDRVHRGDARRLPGPGRPLQRQSALPPDRGAGAAGRRRREGDRLPPALPASGRDGAGPARGHRADRCGRWIGHGTVARQHAVRGGGPHAGHRALARDVARRPLSGVYGRNDGAAQGGAVAPGRHLCLRPGRRGGCHGRVDHRGGDRRHGRRRTLVPGSAADARGGAVDGVLGPEPGRHRRRARRHRVLRRGGRAAA